MDEVFEILKLHNCDFMKRNRWGRMPFQCIINLHPMPKLIEKMLNNQGVDMDSQDIYGSTALHFAAYNGYEEQVELLLEYGANVDVVDSMNDTPIETAKRHGNFKCMKLIFDAKYLYVRENKERFPLYKASEEITLSTLLENPNLREHLHNFPKDFQQYSDYLLKARRTCTLARPSEEHAEDNDVIAAVRHHIEQICQYVNEYDSRFRMTVFPTGSTVEGTKVGRPDEFDFVLCLETIGRYCVIKSPEPYNQVYALLQFKDYPVPEGFLSFSDSEGYFQSLPFLKYLFRYIKRALNERQLWEKGNLYYRYEDKLHVISGKPVFNFQMYWIGSKYKQIALSIDLVPAVYRRGWWPEKACPESMRLVSDRVKDEGCFLLLQTKNNDFNYEWYYMNDIINDSVGNTQNTTQDTHGNNMLRVSVAPAEISLMKSLPEIYRRAYALAKIAKSADICPSVHIDRPLLPKVYRNFEKAKNQRVYPSNDIKSYWLKNCTFFVAEDLGLDISETTTPLDITTLIYKKLAELSKSWSLKPYLLPHLRLLEYGREHSYSHKSKHTILLKRKVCLDVVLGILGEPLPKHEKDYCKWVEDSFHLERSSVTTT
ncbi:uncharacterized protein LOC132721673 [Ruditapes philippinarum]|uniref:uncharacterized protein LOC132721673 n=1 Tax=Ruditapes philippinarum TaxID=129788 RepID=UPI00295B929A|nr:uncharacterized protein LOC132721673 [Ruditapes philippinarum]